METFEITFLNKPCNGESSFVKYTETFLIAAIVTKSEEGLTDRFHITLKDIGLNSLYGEFDILRKNGMSLIAIKSPTKAYVMDVGIALILSTMVNGIIALHI
jgi:hypothetical protein